MVAQMRASGPRKGSHVRHRARAQGVIAAESPVRPGRYPGGPPDLGEPGRRSHPAPSRAGDMARACRSHDARADYVYDRRFDRPDARATFLAPTPEGAPGASTGPTPPAGRSPYVSSLYGQAALLRPEDEACHFLRMNYLKYLAAQLRGTLDPDGATGADLDEIERVQAEARAIRDVIVRANLRLVVAIARNWAGPGRDFDDLVSDGNLTLIHAVSKFDASRGFKFSTYAACAILKNLARASGAEGRRRGRFVTGNVALLDGAAASHDDTPTPERDCLKFQESVRRMLDRLSDREQEVISARFGLGGGPEKTFQQLGEEMGVCRERVRQIQSRALEKLREYAGELGLDLAG